MLDIVNGYKTYIAIALTCVWSVLYTKHLLPISDDNFQLVLVGLLGAAGISMRHGVSKGDLSNLEVNK